jgi:diaminobutyrate-2-oxoglutarate transaminase
MLNKNNDTGAFESLESQVRSYCRSFPTVFETAKGHELVDETGRRYIDLFAGAGALNYGHNPEALKQALLDYVAGDGITHSLDMFTSAKRRFLETFQEKILAPRDLSYRVMFPGPTGTNAVESALKIARKVTGRTSVVSFTNGFHGMTLGALSVTGNAGKRKGAHVPLTNTSALPFDGYLGDDVDTLGLFEQMLGDYSSGLDKPAAVILETTQAEGGVNVARIEWLQRLESLCRAHDVLLIVDDIQVGCGRTGSFFSFDRAGITPDIVTLSKSLSGYGVPLAVVLIRPDLDRWSPGEHNGTFRGHNLAFITATAALETYWSDDALMKEVVEKSTYAHSRFASMIERHPTLHLEHRGVGLIQGLVFQDGEMASQVSHEAFQRGVVIETAGPRGEVLKLLPPLVIEQRALAQAMDVLDESLAAVVETHHAEERKVAEAESATRVQA